MKYILFVFLFIGITEPLFAQENEQSETPLTLSEERVKLKILKNAEFEKQKSILFSDCSYDKKITALRRIAALGTDKSVELLGTLYNNPVSEEKADKEKALVVELLGQIKSPASLDILLKAIKHPGKDGNVRLTSVDALYNTLGKDALPYLKILSEDSVKDVKHAALTKLIELRDLTAARIVFKMLAEDDKVAALNMIKEAHLTEAAEEVARIANETDIEKGPNEKILKLKALETALDLGHKDSVQVAIELIDAISEEQAEVLEVKAPVNLLIKYTGENFGIDKKKWCQWLEDKKEIPPLFSCYLDSTSLKEIGIAVLEWITDKKSGPLVNSSVVYLADSPIATFIAKPDGSIRLYTKEELMLLNVCGIVMNKASSNGLRASIILQVDNQQTGFALQLQKQNNSWQVTGISKGDR